MKKSKLFLAAVTLLTFNFQFSTFNCTAQYTKLLDFNGTNGSQPYGDLISDGTFLYGMTNSGGTKGYGNIFKIKTDSTGYSDLMDFDSINGKNPDASLITDGTYLYGMVDSGGTHNLGVIFKIMPDGSGYTKLLDFDSIKGSHPDGSLTYDGTFLYGMTVKGGTNNMGVLFKIKTDGSSYLDLLNFNGTNGRQPYGSLFYDSTFLYGMTYYGGTNSKGNIFKIKSDGSNYTNLLNFDTTVTGAYPYGSLISDGTFLYGMTVGGGSNGNIFKIKPDGSGYTNLFSFNGTIGGFPYGSLISDGTFLYGMTSYGGTSSAGVLFKINPDGTGYSKLDFNGTNGAYSYGSFIYDGTFLCGMTAAGGTNNMGTVFKYCITPVTFSQSPTVCAGHSVIVGINTYTASATYTDVLTSSRGCDSTVTTHLTVLPANIFSQTITKCTGQSVTVGTHTYTTSGTFTDTLTSYQSCDSIVITNLTVLTATPVTFTQSDTLWTGQSITVGTHTYTVSGTYTDVLTSSRGCDSTVITHVTALPANTFSQTIAKPDHVVVLMLENYGYSKIIGNPNAPHINALINDAHAALFTQSYGLYHPSQPNYVMLYSGNNQGITNDNQPIGTPFHTCNLGASLISKGYTFKGYSEGLPSTGDLTFITGRYVRRHCPWTNWQAPSGINTVDSSVHQPFTSFPTSGNYSTLPTVSFVIPNLDNDMHDPIFLTPNYQVTAVSTGDTWVYNNLTDYINWAKTHNSLLILTFDEDEVLTLGALKSRIPTIFIGQMIRGGSYSTYIDHYTVLRTLEDMYALPYCDTSALYSPITGCWLPISTDIEENTQIESITIFPNPTSGLFQVQSPKFQVQSLKIYNVFGESICSTLRGGAQIDLSAQPNGIYFISVKTNAGIINKKIIISH